MLSMWLLDFLAIPMRTCNLKKRSAGPAHSFVWIYCYCCVLVAILIPETDLRNKENSRNSVDMSRVLTRNKLQAVSASLRPN